MDYLRSKLFLKLQRIVCRAVFIGSLFNNSIVSESLRPLKGDGKKNFFIVDKFTELLSDALSHIKQNEDEGAIVKYLESPRKSILQLKQA